MEFAPKKFSAIKNHMDSIQHNFSATKNHMEFAPKKFSATKFHIIFFSPRCGEDFGKRNLLNFFFGEPFGERKKVPYAVPKLSANGKKFPTPWGTFRRSEKFSPRRSEQNSISFFFLHAVGNKIPYRFFFSTPFRGFRRTPKASPRRSENFSI